MTRAVAFLAVLVVGVVVGRLSIHLTANAEDCAPLQVYSPVGGEAEVYIQDMNGDGGFDAITEAVHLLKWFFAGGPAPVRPCTGSSSGLPDTGQSACYGELGPAVDCTSDTCAGQDGLYATGCPTEGRFVDNQDGTVTDNCTGLMWQKDTGNDGNVLIWCDGLAYCENLELAGHNDWRLPNVRELESIVDYGRTEPAIDPVFGAESGPYWSSTSFVLFDEFTWIVHFSSGFTGSLNDILDGHVRAVRTAE